MPNWESITAFDVAGDVSAFKGLTTRRDVFKAWMFARDDPQAPAVEPDTAKVLIGTGTFDNGVTRFAMFPDGRLTYTAPNGVVYHETWTPQPWQETDPAFVR